MVSTRFEYNDNLRLSANDPVAVTGQTTTLISPVAALQPRQSFRVEPRLQTTERSKGDLFDSDEYRIDAAWLRVGSRWSLGANAGYAIDSTLTTELETTGLVDAQKDRAQQRAGAEFTWFPSALTQVYLSGAWQENRYRDAEQTGLVDYSYAAVSTGVTRALGPVHTVGVAATADRFRTRDGARRSHSQALLATWSATPDPRWQLSAQAGLRRTRSERTVFFFGIPFAEVEDRDAGQTGRVEVSRQGLQDRVSLAISRELRPGGAGAVFERDEVELGYGRKLSPRLRIFTSAKLLRNQEVGGGGQTTLRELTTMEAGASWQMTAQARFRAGYVHRQRKNSGAPRAQGNRVALTLEYQFPRRSLSR